jgi:6-phosphogluconolactonase
MIERVVSVVPDTAALADAVAAHVEDVILDPARKGPAAVSLAGGSTPAAAYRHIASRCVPWRRLDVFFGDERCVPPDHPDSNYGMARRAMLDRVPLRETQVHRIRGEIDPERAAREVEDTLRRRVPGRVPVLDLVLLGMGPDGHTASLFPGGTELEERDRLYAPVHRPEMEIPWRVTMTLPVINAAADVLVAVANAEKAPAVARALAGDRELPIARVEPMGRLTWILTEDAATELSDEVRSGG